MGNNIGLATLGWQTTITNGANISHQRPTQPSGPIVDCWVPARPEAYLLSSSSSSSVVAVAPSHVSEREGNWLEIDVGREWSSGCDDVDVLFNCNPIRSTAMGIPCRTATPKATKTNGCGQQPHSHAATQPPETA